MPKPSPHPTRQVPSTHLIESAGAILFRNLPDSKTTPNDGEAKTPEICILRCQRGDALLHLLGKGRRLVSERRADAALREVEEETGYPCELWPVNLRTRVTSETNDDNVVIDVAGVKDEPFMLTIRDLRQLPGTTEGEERAGVKVIWWFVAVVPDGAVRGAGEDMYEPIWVKMDDAAESMTFTQDADVVRRAVELVKATFNGTFA